MSVLSVDFGTSNTVAVLSAHGRPPRVVDVDGASMMPSALFAGPDGMVVGREAERRARMDPARYEPNPKRRIDDGQLLLGDLVLPVTDAIAAVLGKVAGETQRQLGRAKPEEVRLTHPAQWGPARRNTLLSAARLAGLGPNLTLVPEPVAAAAHYAAFTGRAIAQGEAVAVYDLGAGTFDVAVVGATDQGYAVLAENGLPDLGGLDVDQALLDHIGGQVRLRDPQGWQRLLAPSSTSDRRAARVLRDDVRAAKESLSAHPQTELPLPDPFGDVLVTRAELEQLVRPNLARSVELLAATIHGTGFSADRLAGIYLVGGSSRIPLVASLIAEGLRVVPASLDQPETAVALGAHHVNADGVSLRTRDIAPQFAETRTEAILPPRPPVQARQPAVMAPPQRQPVAAPPRPAHLPFAPQQGGPPNLVLPPIYGQQAAPAAVAASARQKSGTATAAGVVLFVMALGFAINGIELMGPWWIHAAIDLCLTPIAVVAGLRLVRGRGGHAIGIALSGAILAIFAARAGYMAIDESGYYYSWFNRANIELLMPWIFFLGNMLPLALGIAGLVLCLLPSTRRGVRQV